MIPLVEHLFRHRAGRLVAALARRLGPAHLDLAEDIVQDALLEALRSWPFRGVPDDPAAWLFRVARNRALDIVRRDATMRRHERDITHWAEEPRGSGTSGDEMGGDELALVFACCHPAVSREA
ncbi:MAG TPA: sigma factor, partial [Gemmatimonadaceae bacterium]|nr:sigma factor [Gemmatimonadaceae bacterium]